MHGEDRRYALADLEEEFEERVERLGAWSARRWYRAQVMRSLPHALPGRFARRRAMGKNGKSMNGEGMMRGRMQNILTDLRLATRSLRKAPGVLLITVVSLGVGIGAMTAVFGVANSILFRGGVGISDPETLVVIYTSEDDGEAYGTSSYPDYLSVLSEISAIEDASVVNMRTVASGEGDRIEPLLAEEVSGNYFSVTGIRPVIGRHDRGRCPGRGGEPTGPPRARHLGAGGQRGRRSRHQRGDPGLP